MAKLDIKLIAGLPAEAQRAIAHILRKLHAGEKLVQGDIGLVGVSFFAAREKDVAALFHTTTRTIRNWVIDGCPKSADGSYDLFQVHEWLLRREVAKFEKTATPDGEAEPLSVQKTKAEIERIQAQIAKIKNEWVERTLMEQINASRMASLAQYFERAAMKNALQYVGRTLEEIQVIRLAEAKEALRAYAGGANA